MVAEGTKSGSGKFEVVDACWWSRDGDEESGCSGYTELDSTMIIRQHAQVAEQGSVKFGLRSQGLALGGVRPSPGWRVGEQVAGPLSSEDGLRSQWTRCSAKGLRQDQP